MHSTATKATRGARTSLRWKEFGLSCIVVAEATCALCLGCNPHPKHSEQAKKSVSIGMARIEIPSGFICVSKQGPWAIGDPANNTDLLWIYRPSTRTMATREFKSTVSSQLQSFLRTPPTGLRPIAVRTYIAGVNHVSMVEFAVKPTANLLYYAGVLDLEGHATRVEMQLRGGIERPTATGKRLLEALSTLGYRPSLRTSATQPGGLNRDRGNVAVLPRMLAVLKLLPWRKFEQLHS